MSHEGNRVKALLSVSVGHNTAALWTLKDRYFAFTLQVKGSLHGSNSLKKSKMQAYFKNTPKRTVRFVLN